MIYIKKINITIITHHKCVHLYEQKTELNTFVLTFKILKLKFLFFLVFLSIKSNQILKF